MEELTCSLNSVVGTVSEFCLYVAAICMHGFICFLFILWILLCLLELTEYTFFFFCSFLVAIKVIQTLKFNYF